MADEIKTPEKKKFRWGAWYMIIAYIFAGLVIFPFAVNGVRTIGIGLVRYYQSIITPPRYEPRRERGINIHIDGRRGNRKRPARDERGINWSFKTESSADIESWIAGNIPEGATEKDITDISGAFYDSADAIYNGETSTPGRSISFLKKKLMICANDSWEEFFKGLTTMVSYESIDSMDSIAELYEVIGDAIAQAEIKAENTGE